MPFLMTDVAAGAQAQTNIEGSTLQALYQPANYKAEAEQMQTKTQESKARLGELVRNAAQNTETDALTKAYAAAHPNDSVADFSEGMGKELAKTGNMKGSLSFLAEAEKARELEAHAKERLHKEVEDTLDTSHALAKNVKSAEDIDNIKRMFANQKGPQAKALYDSIDKDSRELSPDQFAKKYGNDKTSPLATSKEAVARIRADEVQRQNMALEKLKIAAIDNAEAARERSESIRRDGDVIKIVSSFSPVISEHDRVISSIEKQKANLAKVPPKKTLDTWGGFGSEPNPAYGVYEAQIKLLDTEMAAEKSKKADQVAERDKYFSLLPRGSLEKAKAGLDIAKGKVRETTEKPEVVPAILPPTPSTESDFSSKWKSLKPGESLVGPDGKTYTKKKVGS